MSLDGMFDVSGQRVTRLKLGGSCSMTTERSERRYPLCFIHSLSSRERVMFPINYHSQMFVQSIPRYELFSNACTYSMWNGNNENAM